MANVIVAGGLGTLGQAVVGLLEGRGDRVAIVDRAPAPAAGDLMFGDVDLADDTAVAAAYATAAGVLGGIDGLVNVCGGFAWSPMADGATEIWDEMYRINLRTVAASCRAILPHLATPGGAIVNVGAAAAARVTAGMAPYAASKAGVMALTEGLADELRPARVRVNAVLPTIIDTPANRRDMPEADTSAWVTPVAAARVVAFLLSREAGAVTGVGITLSARD